MIFADYNGYIVAKTDHAIGLGTKQHGDVEFWLPRSQVGCVTYKTGDSKDLFINTALEAIEIPEWLAEERGLV